MVFWVVVDNKMLGIFDDFGHLKYNFDKLKYVTKPFDDFYTAYLYLMQAISWSETFALGIDSSWSMPVNQWIERLK